jgi:hypothetical protein
MKTNRDRLAMIGVIGEISQPKKPRFIASIPMAKQFLYPEQVVLPITGQSATVVWM